MESQTIVITYIKKGEGVDFNLMNVPYDIMLSLIGALRWEFNKKSSQIAAPDFRQERALQHQRHIQQCQKTGDTPNQIFIDFPLY